MSGVFGEARLSAFLAFSHRCSWNRQIEPNRRHDELTKLTLQNHTCPVVSLIELSTPLCLLILRIKASGGSAGQVLEGALAYQCTADMVGDLNEL